jgi:membrane protease YdiL (CAAX protease family)
VAGRETTAERLAPLPPGRRTVMRREVLLLLALSLGQSAVYAIVDLGGKLTSGAAISATNANLNSPKAPPTRPTLDLVYQLLGIAFTLVPVLLACHFLVVGGERATRVLGVDPSQPGRDLGLGVLFALLIGLPGLLLVLLARHLGLSANIVASSLNDVWWRVPVLLLAAAMNAILEETIVVGFLLHRLRQMGWRDGPALLASATLRGSYHLYQGAPAFFGNFVMGLLFGRWYQVKGRVAPLIVAHFLIDATVFVGYAYFRNRLTWLP